jgi:hypothetical protein
MAAIGLEHVFDQERHHLGQADRFLLAVAEGHPLAGDQRLAVDALGVAQHARRVADRTDRLAGLDRRLDQADRGGSSARSQSGPWPPG